MIVYIDVLLVINFLITYFLLICSAVLTGYTYSRKRILISSFVGALSCLYIFVQFKNVVLDIMVKSGVLLICSLIAFGRTNLKKLIVQSSCFVLMNVLLTGLVISISVYSPMIYHKNMFFYININPVILTITTLAVYLAAIIFSFIKDKISSDEIYIMNIFFKDFNITEIGAFYDSGLRMKDIISNKDIVLVSFEKVDAVIPQYLKADINNFFNEKYTDIKTMFVPLFFNTVSGEGVVPAVKAEKIIINDVIIENVLIGFVKNNLSENVDAVFGNGIKRQI